MKLLCVYVDLYWRTATYSRVSRRDGKDNEKNIDNHDFPPFFIRYVSKKKKNISKLMRLCFFCNHVAYIIFPMCNCKGKDKETQRG